MVSRAANSRPQRHPPYKEMIMAAVLQLKRESRTGKGATRWAIANHIAATHSATLSTKHAALLSRHLANLVSSGLLRRVGRYHYTIPRTSPCSLGPHSAGTPRPRSPAVHLPGPGRRGRGALPGGAAALVFPKNVRPPTPPRGSRSRVSDGDTVTPRSRGAGRRGPCGISRRPSHPRKRGSISPPGDSHVCSRTLPLCLFGGAARSQKLFSCPGFPSPMESIAGDCRPRRHPPYKEMIISAVWELKGEAQRRKGASRRAIDKHIAATHSATLSTRHAALLTHHLAALTSSGLLRRVGRHCYTLPAQSPPRPLPLSAAQRRGGAVLLPSRGHRRGGLRGRASVLVFPCNLRPPSPPPGEEDATPAAGSGNPRRGRGRPRAVRRAAFAVVREEKELHTEM